MLCVNCSYQKKDKSSAAKFGSLNQNLLIFYEEYVEEIANQGEDKIGLFDTKVAYQKVLADDNTSTEYFALRDSIFTHIKDGPSNKTPAGITAFYINAYNFLAIQLLIQNAEGDKIPSIIDIGGTESYKAFEDKEYAFDVDGEKVTLNQIEKERIPAVWKDDARLHFAVICASKGCPILLNTPYQASTLEKQLDFITRAAMQLERMYKDEKGKIELSMIFNWYKEDFYFHMTERLEREDTYESDVDAVKDFIQYYSSNNRNFFSLKEDGTKENKAVVYPKYDWSPNGGN
jgi:hypothetical protein